jgi:short-subunit dehydrogenase
MDSLSDRAGLGTALVTGGTSGLGLEFARQLGARGHDLVLVARDEARLQAVADELTARGVSVEVLAADLTDRSRLAEVEARVADPDRPVELVVNNAGFGVKGHFVDHHVEVEQAQLDVLVTAVMRLSHAALTAMVGRGRGGLINVSSVAAYLPRGSYSAAKAWVATFGRWAHQEYAGRGVRVTTVSPGFVRTEFHERLGGQEGTGPLWMDAEEVVRQALRDFDRGRSLSIPGARYKALTTLARAVPTGVLQRFQSVGR